MRLALDPFRLLLVSLAGWLNQQQQDVIDYLQEENRVLREQLGGKRLHFNDDQRRQLAVKAKKLGWRMLQEVTLSRRLETLIVGRMDCSGTKPSRDRVVGGASFDPGRGAYWGAYTCPNWVSWPE